MDTRLNFVVEGQTEETFVNQVMRPHLADRRIWAYVDRRAGHRMEE